MGATLTSEVKEFIHENIASYEDLQILLLMHDHPGRKWDAVDIAEQLRIEPLSASTHLMNLHWKGLIGHEKSKSHLYDFQYVPLPQPKEEQVSALASTFDRARVEVVDYIFKMSRGHLQSFADAFKIKKDK